MRARARRIVDGWLKISAASSQQDADDTGPVICYGQIQLAVLIEVPSRQVARTSADRLGDCWKWKAVACRGDHDRAGGGRSAFDKRTVANVNRLERVGSRSQHSRCEERLAGNQC